MNKLDRRRYRVYKRKAPNSREMLVDEGRDGWNTKTLIVINKIEFPTRWMRKAIKEDSPYIDYDRRWIEHD